MKINPSDWAGTPGSVGRYVFPPLPGNYLYIWLTCALFWGVILFFAFFVWIKFVIGKLDDGYELLDFINPAEFSVLIYMAPIFSCWFFIVFFTVIKKFNDDEQYEYKLASQHINEPWHWNRRWENGSILCDGAESQTISFISIFLLIMAGVSLIQLTFFVLTQSGIYAWFLGFYILLLLALPVLFYYFRKSLSSVIGFQIHGRAELKLDNFPVRLGEHLRGSLHGFSGLFPGEVLDLRLFATYTDLKSESVVHRIRHSFSGSVRVEHSENNIESIALVDFPMPEIRDDQELDMWPTHECDDFMVDWTLEVSSNEQSDLHTISFPIPVMPKKIEVINVPQSLRKSMATTLN